MSFVKGAVLALLVVLCVAAQQVAATCRANAGTPFDAPPAFLGGCAPPREGLWRFQSNFEFDPAVGREPVAIAELNLVRVAENLYNASGLLDTVNGLFSDVPVTLSALYNPCTCYLTGTGFAPATATADGFTWWSTGTTLYGPYVVNINSTLASPLLGISNATFIGY